jgi:hypothetical protein
VAGVRQGSAASGRQSVGTHACTGRCGTDQAVKPAARRSASARCISKIPAKFNPHQSLPR